jgi:hypothetical protein
MKVKMLCQSVSTITKTTNVYIQTEESCTTPAFRWMFSMHCGVDGTFAA